MNGCLEDINFDLSTFLRSTNPSIVPKQCCHNSLCVLNRHPEYNFLYVEGFAVLARNGLVIEHRWLEPNWKIVDVTLPDEVIKYCAVDKLTQCEARQAGINERYVPEWYERRHKDPSLPDRIRNAYSEAHVFVEKLKVDSPIV